MVNDVNEVNDKSKSGIETGYTNFQNIFIQVLNNHAPAKEKNSTFQ